MENQEEYEDCLLTGILDAAEPSRDYTRAEITAFEDLGNRRVKIRYDLYTNLIFNGGRIFEIPENLAYSFSAEIIVRLSPDNTVKRVESKKIINKNSVLESLIP